MANYRLIDLTISNDYDGHMEEQPQPTPESDDANDLVSTLVRRFHLEPEDIANLSTDQLQTKLLEELDQRTSQFTGKLIKIVSEKQQRYTDLTPDKRHEINEIAQDLGILIDENNL